MTNRRVILAFIVLLMAIGGFWLGIILRLLRIGHEPSPTGPLLLAQFADVGDGDAALVTSPDGLSIMIDAGPDESAAREIITQIQRVQQAAPNVIILTCARARSIGGLPYLLAHTGFHGPIVLPCPPARFAEMGGTPARDALSAAGSHHLQVVSWDQFESSNRQSLLAAGQAIATPILVRNSSLEGRKRPLDANPEDAIGALAVRVDYGEGSLLYCAGLTTREEDEMIAQGKHITCDVLAATDGGHEGAQSNEFLALAGPSVVAVSASQGDPPDPEALRRLRAADAVVERTDLLGSVTVGISSEATTPVSYFGPEAVLPVDNLQPRRSTQ